MLIHFQVSKYDKKRQDFLSLLTVLPRKSAPPSIKRPPRKSAPLKVQLFNQRPLSIKRPFFFCSGDRNKFCKLLSSYVVKLHHILSLYVVKSHHQSSYFIKRHHKLSSYVILLTHPFTYSLIPSLTHSSLHLLTPPLTSSLLSSLTHSSPHLLTHPFI